MKWVECTLVFYGILCACGWYVSGPTLEEDEKKRGQKAYMKYACDSCHGKDGMGRVNITNAFRRYTDDQLRAYIEDPKQFGNREMPAFVKRMPEEDLNAIVVYVKALGREAERRRQR